jgi:16S rRNA (uracil1498-N3)-methyltransferase
MQCRRSRLPEVDEPVGLADLATPGVLVVGDPAGRAVIEVPIPESGEWLAVVGAEGGLEPAEQATLRAQPRVIEVAVGPHVLRTETAAVALAAALATRRFRALGHSR